MVQKLLPRGLAFKTHKLGKSTQLSAVLILGLVLVDAVFLSAAGLLAESGWVTGVLVVAAVLNVPFFVWCVFRLQTKYRPELQDDEYYFKYRKSLVRGGHIYKQSDEVFSLEPGWTLERVRAEELKEFEKFVESAGLVRDQRFELGVFERYEWDEKRISLNVRLDRSEDLLKLLRVLGYPDIGWFGTEDGLEPPSGFVLAFGIGFNLNEIKRFLLTMEQFDPDRVVFAEDERKFNEFENQILVGVYLDRNEGVPFRRALDWVQDEKATELGFYKLLGYGTEFDAKHRH